MVHMLADPALSPNATPTYETPSAQLVRRPSLGRKDSAVPMTREEHAERMRELNKKRGMMRAPRRGWSLTEYQGDYETSQQFSGASASQVARQASIPENAPLATEERPRDSPAHAQGQTSQLARRPKIPPPRRSYSVTDSEPVPPGQPQPSKNFTLLDLPSELHYTIFDFLDPIDSTCFGLTNSNFYDIHRRLHGKVPLSSRYSGPNDLEWAWRGAGSIIHPRDPSAVSAMEQMRVKGQVYCRKCGISRCELHRHLKEWMGENNEYCSIKERFGKPAGEGAKTYCHMKSPKNPHRCGRHGGKPAGVKA